MKKNKLPPKKRKPPPPEIVMEAVPVNEEEYVFVPDMGPEGIDTPTREEFSYVRNGRTIYEIVRLLNTGSMGSIYEGFRLKDGLQVALKFPQMETLEKAARFLREARSMEKLRHPNIVKFLDFCDNSSCPFLVMELIEGENLKQILEREGILDLPFAASIILQIADGLLCLEKQGIIHRDIKPANIMIEPGGLVKLIDFGIAKFADPEENIHITRTSLKPATFLYAPPEQLLEGAHVSKESDAYSLGIILHEMLFGRSPFTGTSQNEIAAQKFHSVFDKSSLATIPWRVSRLIQQMLKYESGKRPSFQKIKKRSPNMPRCPSLIVFHISVIVFHINYDKKEKAHAQIRYRVRHIQTIHYHSSWRKDFFRYASGCFWKSV